MKKKETKCSVCGLQTDQPICPACKTKLRSVESIPLESTGVTRKNLRLIVFMAADAAALAVTDPVLAAENDSEPTSSAVSESDTEPSSQPETSSLPGSLLDE